MHHERAPHAQFAQRPRHQLRQARVVDAHHLRRGARGIRQRPEQIEHRAHLAARGARPSRGAWPYASPAQTEIRCRLPRSRAPRAPAADRCARPSCFEHVRRPAARADRAVAMLRHAHARARDHERRGGGNVERAAKRRRPCRTCPQALHRAGRQSQSGKNRRRVAPHRRREAHQLVHRFALHAQRGQQRGDLRVARVPERICSIAASASTRERSSPATIFSSAS